MAVHDSLKEEITRISEENSVLKTLVAEFKEQLCNSLDTKNPQSTTSAFSPNFTKQTTNSNSSTQNLSSISHPAILWKELELERRRSIQHRRQADSLQSQLDTLNAGGAVDKLAHCKKQLQKRIDELTEENRALTNIQRNQEKQLLSEEVSERPFGRRGILATTKTYSIYFEPFSLGAQMLEQDWPIKLAVLQQDLNVAEDGKHRSQQLASKLRKKGFEQSAEISSLKSKNKGLKVSDRSERALVKTSIRATTKLTHSIYFAHLLRSAQEENINKIKETAMLSETVPRKQYQRLSSENSKLEDDKDKLKNSIRANDRASNRDINICKVQITKKDNEIKDLKRRLLDNEIDARKNLLNMKKLEKTLAGIAVGNLKVKEVSTLLPTNTKLDVLNLKALETILPNEIDCERTNFLSPQPPPSELKKTFKFDQSQTRNLNY